MDTSNEHEGKDGKKRRSMETSMVDQTMVTSIPETQAPRMPSQSETLLDLEQDVEDLATTLHTSPRAWLGEKWEMVETLPVL